MTQQNPPARRARERILDAAAEVMRRDGLVHATTKQIAREAECSEALLYKHFPDKRDIFLSVLAERSTGLGLPAEMAGTSTVRKNLVELTERSIVFYQENFPMAASIFGSTDLLTSHRNAMQQRGVGPHAVSAAVEQYLLEEAHLGRVDAAAVDAESVARLLTGGALHEAFLATYASESVEDPRRVAQRLVDSVNLGEITD
ncbi:MAG TPA: TetR/AcrR family transcriptional regulator [Candidatus Agrococcus pullicola]|uniref:TetR/AcrR family transcriptional regulator n=1 Tax=Candidatus Agrococcus pullicola TaxID=2838429 RepID=A0A9D1YRS2_9MICO|nr:TetR/AcrR family transcriptional regulator [Candidatus Agrococcus pullicola]